MAFRGQRIVVVPESRGIKRLGGIHRSGGVLVVLVTGKGGVGEAGGVARFGIGETDALAVENQLGVVDEGHAVGVGELLGAGSDEVDVGAFLENEARGVNGIAQVLDASDAAGFHATAVHEESVELHAAVGGEKASATSVKGRVIFEDGNCCFDRVECGAATGENFVAGDEGVSHACLVGGCRIRRNSPGSAMDEEGGVVRSGKRGH